MLIYLVVPSLIFNVVSYPFITIASLFHTKPVIEQDGPQSDLGSKKVAQSKKENSGVKKEKTAESASSKRPGPKPSADADALD